MLTAKSLELAGRIARPAELDAASKPSNQWSNHTYFGEARQVGATT